MMLEEGDPIAALIDRIESVKTSFELFSNGLKDHSLEDDQDDDMDDCSQRQDMVDDSCLVDDMATADMETKISNFESLLERLSDVVTRMESSHDDLPFSHDDEDEDDDDDDDDYASLGNNAVVTDYEGLIQRLLVPFLDAVNGVGGEVQEQGAYVAQVLGAQREMLVQVARMPQPSEDDFMEMLQSTNHALALVDQCNEEASVLRKHTAMVAGAMTAFGWVTSPDPRQYIGDMLNAVPVYGRQILNDFAGEHHQGLVESLKLLLRGLQEYVTAHHGHGLSWNGRTTTPATSVEEGGPPRAGGAKPHNPLAFTSDREAKLDFSVMFASYEQFMAQKVVPFIQAAYALQVEELQVQADYVQKALKAQYDFMRIVAACKRPTDHVLALLLQETSEALIEIEERSNKDSLHRHHLTLVASGMPCLAWVSVPMNPSSYISDMINSIPVFGDKILREFGKAEDGALHASFVLLFRNMLRGLNEYVRTFHAKGVSWNMDGMDYMQWAAAYNQGHSVDNQSESVDHSHVDD